MEKIILIYHRFLLKWNHFVSFFQVILIFPWPHKDGARNGGRERGVRARVLFKALPTVSRAIRSCGGMDFGMKKVRVNWNRGRATLPESWENRRITLSIYRSNRILYDPPNTRMAWSPWHHVMQGRDVELDTPSWGGLTSCHEVSWHSVSCRCWFK